MVLSKQPARRPSAVASGPNNPRWEFSLKSSKLKRSKGVKFGGMYSPENKLYYQQMSYRGAMLLPFQVRHTGSSRYSRVNTHEGD